MKIKKLFFFLSVSYFSVNCTTHALKCPDIQDIQDIQKAGPSEISHHLPPILGKSWQWSSSSNKLPSDTKSIRFGLVTISNNNNVADVVCNYNYSIGSASQREAILHLFIIGVPGQVVPSGSTEFWKSPGSKSFECLDSSPDSCAFTIKPATIVPPPPHR